jgi:serine/threonine-protein kinase
MEREEIAGDARRLAQICRYGAWTWAFIYALDAVLAKTVYGTSLLEIGILRVLGCLFIVLVAFYVTRWPPRSRGAMTGVIGVLGFGVTVFIGAIAVRLGGLQSPYSFGVAFPIAAFGLMQRRARDALPALFSTCIGYPIGLLGLEPALRAELMRGNAAMVFGAEVVLMLTLGAFAAILSHYGWTLRRALFESRSIGRYQLKRRLGRGGMGEVWFHTTLRRNVAVKILRPERTDEAAVQRFEREVRATSELSHPNTVRVFDYGVTEDGLWYFAMELLDGVTLARLVSAQGPVDPARAVHFVSQAARALAEAHRHGIVHRDLKPDNLIVTTAGDEVDFVKVIDFGIAKQMGDSETSSTRAGNVAGTPAYMAPEVAEGHRANARSDVYSLGAVFYYLLVGSPPFTSESAMQVMLSHMNDPVVPPGQRMPVPPPPDVEGIVMRCLAKAPEERFADATELATALAACSLHAVWQPETAPPYPAPSTSPLAIAPTAPAVTRSVDTGEESQAETVSARPPRKGVS